LRLKSKDFEDNTMIPRKFTCDGDDVSPQLSWEDVPEGTKSFALSIEDPDAPMGTFIHWLVHDIPKDVAGFDQGSIARGSRQVTNDFRKQDYGGPSPPSGTHRYIFTVYALDIEHLEGVNRKNFFDLVKKHTIDKAKLIGLYKRT
jgi:Raf kinase inhibitor-like YbhB/YbcL family protein